MDLSKNNGGGLKFSLGRKSQKNKKPKRLAVSALESPDPKKSKQSESNQGKVDNSYSQSDERQTTSEVNEDTHASEIGTASSLDSYLNSINDTQISDQFTVNSDDEDTENNRSEPRIRESKPKNSKLEKIGSEYSVTPFVKQVYKDIGQGVDGDVYRAANGIAIEGSNISPIPNWYQAGLPLPLIRAIEKLSYDKPTPIQAQSLPILMSGHNMLGIAPTGCGKTAAFTIPLCRHVSANRAAYAAMRSNGGPYALILVPTRELCMQIKEELEKFAEELEISVLGCYGGVDIAVQISQIIKGACNIIVATPGRLIDLLAANHGRVLSLKAVTSLVIDETDRMFDLGFGPQVRKILAVVRPDRQTAVFSATMSGSMERIVQSILKDPMKVSVGVKSTVPKNVHQSALLVNSDKKFSRLLEKLPSDLDGKTKAAIIFVNTQTSADSLSLQLVQEGYNCQALHGGMDQRDRDETMNAFKRGELPLLVATSIAARGLDVSQLKLVINYDPASHIEDYVHRAGRTGRTGNEGECITFLEHNNKRQAYELASLFETDAKVKKLADSYRESQDQEAQRNADSEERAEKFKREMIGFGGHGLSKLDEKREFQKSVVQDVYLDGTSNQDVSKILKDIISKVGNIYIFTLGINDISKETRTAVTALQKQNEIIENYNVSITLKGEYIARVKPGTPENKKLHLQVEGSEYENVASAYTDLVEIINNRAPEGRYSEF